jgi:hypothetical protein
MLCLSVGGRYLGLDANNAPYACFSEMASHNNQALEVRVLSCRDQSSNRNIQAANHSSRFENQTGFGIQLPNKVAFDQAHSKAFACWRYDRWPTRFIPLQTKGVS